MLRIFMASIIAITLLTVDSSQRSSLADQGDASAAARITFTDVTQELGLSDPLCGMMGHAAAWGDADGDGRMRHLNRSSRWVRRLECRWKAP